MGRNFLAVLYACFLCLGFLSCSNVKSMSLMAIGNYEYVRGNYQNAISNYYNLVEDKNILLGDIIILALYTIL